MDINRLTEKAQEAVVERPQPCDTAGTTTDRARTPASGLARAGAGRRATVLDKAGVKVDALRDRRRPRGAASAEDQRRGQRSASGSRLNRVLLAAEDEAKELKDDFVAVEHLLLSCSKSRRQGPVAARKPALARDKLLAAPARGARQSARHQPEPRRDLPGAGEVRPRPDRDGPARTSSTRSSAATRRSAASSRCCRGAPRTTRC